MGAGMCSTVRRQSSYTPVVDNLPPGATWTSTNRFDMCPRPRRRKIWSLRLASGESCVYDTIRKEFVDAEFEAEVRTSSKVVV